MDEAEESETKINQLEADLGIAQVRLSELLEAHTREFALSSVTAQRANMAGPEFGELYDKVSTSIESFDASANLQDFKAGITQAFWDCIALCNKAPEISEAAMEADSVTGEAGMELHFFPRIHGGNISRRMGTGYHQPS